VGLAILFTGTASPRAGRLAAWLLAISFLPMLTFVGHWPAIEIPLPGTDAFLRVPLTGTGHADAGTHAHTGSAHSHDGESGDGHAQHCHAGSAGCSDTPVPGLSTVAMLRDVVGSLGATDAWLSTDLASDAMLRPISLIPLDPPPRLA